MSYCRFCGELDLPVHKSFCIYKGDNMAYKQKKAYVMIGPSGSGKSTVRSALVEKHAGDVVRQFSLDDCRINFFLEKKEREANEEGLTQGDLYGKAFAYANKRGKEFDAYVAEAWKESRNAQVVIVDNVHGTRKSRKPWVDALKKDNFHITMVQIQTPLEVILERQNTRGDKKVPADIVRQMYMRQEEAMVGSECDALLVIDGTKPTDGQLK